MHFIEQCLGWCCEGGPARQIGLRAHLGHGPPLSWWWVVDHRACNTETKINRHIQIDRQARLSGTLCPRTCGIQMFLRTVTGSHWRRFYFRSTSVFSALEVFLRECAI